jgi:hypothetical protein
MGHVRWASVGGGSAPFGGEAAPVDDASCKHAGRKILKPRHRPAECFFVQWGCSFVPPREDGAAPPG